MNSNRSLGGSVQDNILTPRTAFFFGAGGRQQILADGVFNGSSLRKYLGPVSKIVFFPITLWFGRKYKL